LSQAVHSGHHESSLGGTGVSQVSGPHSVIMRDDWANRSIACINGRAAFVDGFAGKSDDRLHEMPGHLAGHFAD